MATIALPVMQRPHFDAAFERDLRRTTLQTLQINIGRLCNIACNHCHVESSPARTAHHENMNDVTARRVVDWGLAQPEIRTVDFTGGSPEMNPNFRWMVEEFASSGRHVMARCNPTIMCYTGRSGEEDYSWIPDFYARHGVEVVASMPCYVEANVNRQRGVGAFTDSIQGLRRLNAVGYGCDDRLRLQLVYNPVGASLPPPQQSLESNYKEHLKNEFGIVFNELWTITNMPIKRWRHELEREGQLESYMTLLIDAFNEQTLDGLMCRHQINVGPNGEVYDCDFNLALDLPTNGLGSRPIWAFEASDFLDRPIATGDHCYGCTAGCGSSCGGALIE